MKDYTQLARNFNQVRLAQVEPVSREEMIQKLKQVGIPAHITYALIRKGYIRATNTSIGNTKEYSFLAIPLYKAQLAAIYQEATESHNKYYRSVSEKTVAFDLVKFAKENPELYKKYCYEIG